jgi:hypothetical protein
MKQYYIQHVLGTKLQVEFGPFNQDVDRDLCIHK